MHPIDQIVAWTGPVLQACIAGLMWSKQLHRRFPLFFIYTVYSIITTATRNVLFIANSRSFAVVFWSTEAVYVLLGLAAIYESFRKLFRPLYGVWWFRILVYLVVIIPLALSVRAILKNPPTEANGVGAAILLVEIGARYVQGGLFALSFITIRFFRLPASRYASGIVDGFGIAAIGILAGSILRSVFGTNFNTFFRFAPVVAYIIALLVWLVSLLGREEENGENMMLPVPLEQMPGDLRRQIELIRKARKPE